MADEYRDGKLIFRDLQPTENKKIVEPADMAESRRLARLWKGHIEDYDRKHSKWIKTGGDIVRRFRDDRDKTAEEGHRKFNSLYAWFETIRPAVYIQTPNPIVERQFQDKDPLGRKSAQILERTLRSEMKRNGFHQAMERVVSDYLLPGRGVAWVRHEPEYGESDSIAPVARIDMEDAQGQIMPKDEGGDFSATLGDRRVNQQPTDSLSGNANSSESTETEELEKLEDTGSELLAESVPVDHVAWKDFRTYPSDARSWQEVTAVSKDVYLSGDDCIEQFGEKVGSAIEPEGLEPQKGLMHDKIIEIEDKHEKKRRITEIWDRNTRTVLWVSNGYQYLCGKIDDPLKLTHFFPCPEPLQSITTTDTLTPVPFFHQWSDQAKQVDDYTQRIHMLSKALIVRGFYDQSAKNLQRLLNEAKENDMIPIENWAAMGEKGIESIVSFYPTEVLAATLNHVVELREKIYQDMDLLTGIGDVMRGTGDARETKGGVTLKANASGTRVEAMKRNVGRFASELTNIIGEVVSNKFKDKTLAEESGIFFEEGIDNDMGLTLLGKMEADPEFGMMFGMGQGMGSFQSTPPQGMQGGPTVPAIPPPSPQGIGNSYAQPQPPQMPQGTANPMAGQTASPAMLGQSVQPPQGLPQGTANSPQLPRPQPAQQQMPVAQPQPQINPQIQQLQQLFTTVHTVKDAIDLLRCNICKAYRIEVEVDSMIQGDVQQKRQDSSEFLVSVTGFMEKTGLAQSPHASPLLAKFLSWGTRQQGGIGRDLEQAIEEFADAVIKDSQNPQQKGPSPEQLKLQAATASAQAKLQSVQAQSQADAAQAQAEIQRQQIENQGEASNAQQETQQRQMDLEIQRMQMQIELTKLQIEKVKAEAMLRGAHIDAAQSLLTPRQPNTGIQ